MRLLEHLRGVLEVFYIEQSLVISAPRLFIRTIKICSLREKEKEEERKERRMYVHNVLKNIESATKPLRVLVRCMKD